MPRDLSKELDRWNTRYAAPGYLFGEAPNHFLGAQGPLLKRGQRALCVADGEGRNSVWLAEQGLDVTAFDLSPVAIEKARGLAARRQVRVDYQLNDLEGFAWPAATCDVVAAIFVQFAAPDLRRFMFGRIAAALKPGGILILTGYTPKQLEYKTGGPSEIENLYTEAMLRIELVGFNIESMDLHDTIVDEGPGHKGMSALIDVIARRT
ncbi:MAG: class I SAM-dependent methyltransferase [Burkholderiales bacterium]